MKKTAYLVLENGKVFQGKSFGAEGEIISEIVFATSLTGYLETLTDKSYYGQAVVQTFPLIGNYGVIPDDFESDRIGPNAYIVKHWCEEPSNFRSEGDLDTFLKSRNIIGLCEIDTRALTKIIREHGVMNGIITQNPGAVDLEKVKAYRIQQPVKHVTTPAPYDVKAENAEKNVVLWDFGTKDGVIRALTERGCNVHVVPAGTPASEILALHPDGIMLSNGPGNPTDNMDIVAEIKKVVEAKIPIFGICLGHLLLALANGCRTTKLKYGHHGENQPVRHIPSGKIYITSQSHGYAILSDSIDQTIATELFVNVNDATSEGMEYHNAPAFSVQFHPEACAGPQDTMFLFDQFIRIMEGK